MEWCGFFLEMAMKINVSLASWPMARHEDALQSALSGVSDPMFGPLAVEHIQLVPQNRGVLTAEFVARLREMAPGARFRLHANVRVLPQHRFADLTNAHLHWDYFLSLAQVHRATGATVYSAHSGLKTEGSWQDTMKNVYRLQDLLGCPVAVEGQYPTLKPMHLSTWQEYAALLEADLYYVVDLSHLHIVATQTRRVELNLTRELLANPRCLEVHLSDNDGRGDWHALCGRHVWWMEALSATHPEAVIFSEGNQRRPERVLGKGADLVSAE
ncbi:MAG: hypothetical protein N2690_01250 [Rhodocyclaceae bacterium]|nr:hypothetical protein [Rhodocyclaceae bacterium]